MHLQEEERRGEVQLKCKELGARKMWRGQWQSKQTELTETATGSEILSEHIVPVIEGEPEVIEVGKAQ